MAHFSIPRHIFLGESAITEAIPYMKQLGKRTLIVTGKHVGKSPMMKQLQVHLKESDIAFDVFDGITGEPDDKMITAGVKIYRECEAQFIIGIGGGSPIDSAKAIAAMSVNAGNIADYSKCEISGEIPGIVAIPTTAGTGSEATKFTVITDSEKDIKMLLKGEKLVPTIAILASGFTADMPKKVTAMTGLDALTHAVEAYTSRKASHLTDVYAISAVKRIMKYLPVAYSDGYDEKARLEMSLAAFEAGVCIDNSSVTLVHGMSRPIGALFHVPHGISNAMLLKICLEFALDGALERFALLGREIGVADQSDSDKFAANEFLKAIENLISVCQIPSPVGYGIPQEDFENVIDKMAADAIASGSPGNTRKEVTKEDCIKMYHQLYE